MMLNLKFGSRKISKGTHNLHMFGTQRKTAEADLSSALQAADDARRAANARLQEAHQKIGQLEQMIEVLKADLSIERKKVEKARIRQKNSVERANRFKTQLDKLRLVNEL